MAHYMQYLNANAFISFLHPFPTRDFWMWRVLMTDDNWFNDHHAAWCSSDFGACRWGYSYTHSASVQLSGVNNTRGNFPAEKSLTKLTKLSSIAGLFLAFERVGTKLQGTSLQLATQLVACLLAFQRVDDYNNINENRNTALCLVGNEIIALK